MASDRTAPNPVPDALVGSVFGGNYQIVRLVASGGMGSLYEAKHTRLPRRFAVKVIRAELVTAPGVVERFRREAEIASSLGNPHIVDVVDFDVLPDGSPYMVMELLEGEDLGQRLARLGRLSLAETGRLLEQLALGLGAAHERGIIHRDIKPENVFLSRHDGLEVLKVLDFGLSKVVSSQRMTQSQTSMGTPLYMSPEQIRGDRDIDLRTDIYSVGVLLYQVLTGRLPFFGEQPFEVFNRVMNELPPPLQPLVPDLPLEVSALVLRMLEKQREHRPASMGEVLTQFRRATGAPGQPEPSAPLLVPTPSQVQRGQLDTFISGPKPDPVEPELSPAPARRRFGPATLVVGLLLLAGAAWVGSQHLRAETPAPAPAPVIAPVTPAQPVVPPPAPAVAAPPKEVVVPPAATKPAPEEPTPKKSPGKRKPPEGTKKVAPIQEVYE